MRLVHPKPSLACALALVALGGFALTPGPASGIGAAAKPTGKWKLSLSIDFESSAKATDTHCFPDRSATDPSPVDGATVRKVTVRTTRSPLVEFHEAPNGVPVAMESNYTRAYRGKVSETRVSDVDSGGDPIGCFGPKPKPRCGTQSVASGLYVNPLGRIHSWKGFTLELEQEPISKFQGCGLTDAEEKTPYPVHHRRRGAAAEADRSRPEADLQRLDDVEWKEEGRKHHLGRRRNPALKGQADPRRRLSRRLRPPPSG